MAYVGPAIRNQAGKASQVNETIKNIVKQKAAGSSSNGGGTSGSTGGTATSTYTESIAADAGLSDAAKAQIQGYRDQAKAGLISWDQANQAANAVRMGQGGYSVDKTGAATYSQPAGQQFENFEQYMDAMGYGDYSEQTQAAIKAAVQRAVSGYNQQIETTNEDSDELARQAYVAKMLGEKNLDQQLAANGYSGGMADSQRIAVETNYENTLADIEQQRLATIRELETAIEQAKLTGDMQAAQELSGYLQQLISGWASYVQNQQSINNQNYWNQRQMAQTEQQLAAQSKEAAYTQALNLISQGFMPDDATLTAAGISKLEAQSRLNQVKSLLAADVADATAPRGTPVYRPGDGTPEDGSAGVGAETMSQLKRQMGAIMQPVAAGKVPVTAALEASLQNLIDQYKSQMTEDEKNEIYVLMKQYGFAD